MIKIYSIRENAINEIIDKYLLFFLSKKNVVGLGLGYKNTKKFETNKLSLHVFVKKKVTINTLNKKDIIPINFLGIPTDVIEVGDFKKSFSHGRNSITSFPGINKIRPLKAGYSIGPSKENYSATIGAIVFDNKSNKPHILSTNHVLANINKLKTGTTILQPSMEDGGNLSFNTVAKLTKFIALKYKDPFYMGDIGIKKEAVNYVPSLENDLGRWFSETKEKDVNYVDCAIAKINSGVAYDTSIEDIGTIKGTILPKNHMKVQKFGRTSGYTTGSIISVNSSVEIEIEEFATCQYKNQIVATSMSNFGDSGSLVLDFNNRAVGLLHSSSDRGALICPIKLVLKLLNIHF